MRDGTEVLEKLHKKITDDRDFLSAQVARGMVKDHADYLNIVGRISALDTIYDAINEMVEEMEKEE